MKKAFAILLSLLLGLSACGPAPAEPGRSSDTTVLAATTYPVYLFVCAVTEGVDGYEVELVIDQPISCIHDYTLSVRDMQTLEGADCIFLNGAGLEESMESALSAVDAAHIIDCSAGIEPLAAEEAHSDSDHAEADPHIWLDPTLACVMLTNIADGLSSVDPGHADAFAANAQAAAKQIQTAYAQMKAQLSDLPCRELITFHDGFQYFARAFDLTILRAIEEEAGSEASAKEVGEIISDVEEHRLPAVFTETNGSTATAEMIARECGIGLACLDLIMSRAHGDAAGIGSYLSRLADNVSTVREAYS